MPGLLYKELHNNPKKLILILTTLLSILTTAILLAVKEELDDSSGVLMIFSLLFYVIYLLPSLTGETLFKNDESRTCSAFALSLPQGAKGHIEAKYAYLFLIHLSIYLITALANLITSAGSKGTVDFGVYLSTLFFLRLLIAAVETPFVIRFGSSKGPLIKSATVLVVMLILYCYVLFGDISWIKNSVDPLNSLIKWFGDGKYIKWICIFPFFSILIFCLSCRISISLFRKGAESL